MTNSPGYLGSTPAHPALVRPRDDRWVAGVCSGIARRFGLDPTLVRVIFLVSILLPGPQSIAYLIAWLLIPSE
jgi:phage shock protein PspC (stress-responsive transcriptional regulator)